MARIKPWERAKKLRHLGLGQRREPRRKDFMAKTVTEPYFTEKIQLSEVTWHFKALEYEPWDIVRSLREQKGIGYCGVNEILESYFYILVDHF